MQAKQARDILGVTQQTLSKYVLQGKIKAKTLSSGIMDYDDESVYDFLEKRGANPFSNRKNYYLVISKDASDYHVIPGYALLEGASGYAELIERAVQGKVSKVSILNKNIPETFLQALIELLDSYSIGYTLVESTANDKPVSETRPGVPTRRGRSRKSNN